MKDLKVWTRFGDNDDYESYDTPHEAGYTLACLLNPDGNYPEWPELRYRPLGVECEGFTGNNYISLFWGDDDAQPRCQGELNPSDKLDFEQGLSEGLNNS